MRVLFSPPSLDDLIRWLKAWRIWVLSALVGVLAGAGLFSVAPPPYRARATVNVDFNLEDAWPEDVDRQQFYYLERETRKLEELAWSDDVLAAVAAQDGALSIEDLRGGVLELSQPREAGWHFFAVDARRSRAEALASSWAQAFVSKTEAAIANEVGIDAFITLEPTQVEDLPVVRSASMGAYMLAGSLVLLFLSSLAVLFFDFGQKGRGHEFL